MLIKDMNKKRTYLLTAALLLTVTHLAAQARFSANTEQHTFGQVEWKQPVTAEYIVTNTGNAPLQLTAVEPDCACTVARWTETPIASGASGSIQVTFDAKQLGYFHKSVAVHSNATTQPVYLYLDGQVVREVRDYARTHPYRIGDIRLDRTDITFDEVRLGEHPTLQIGVVNLGTHPYEPILMHLPSYIHGQAAQPVLQPGEKTTLTLTLDSERLNDLGVTETSVYLSRFTGDKVGSDNEIPLSILLLPDFSTLTEAERANAPVVSLSAKDVDVHLQLQKKAKVKQDIWLANNGRSPLKIAKLQVLHPALGVSLKKGTLQPGETTRLRITVDRKNLHKKNAPLRLLMITNDPASPKMTLEVKAE